MRRFHALIATLVVAASLLFVGATSAIAATAPAPTANPASPAPGETFTLTGNIGTTGSRAVELQRDDSGTWTKYKSGTTNSSGDYSFTAQTTAATRTYRIHAAASGSNPSVDTEALVITTTSGGGGGGGGTPTTPVATPSSPVSGASFTITGNIGTTGSRAVELQRNDSGTWNKYKTGTTTSSGGYTFTASTTEPTRIYRVHAAASGSNPAVDSPSLTVTTIQPPSVSLHILRDCTGNTCADTATANVETTPAQQGRVFKLQYKSGSSWVAVVGSTPAPTGSDGKVKIPFSLTGVSQWTARTYRATSDADASNAALTSPDDSFMPGPTQLGKNVLRVDVDKGVFPTSKSSEYTGKATLSVDGAVNLDHVALEKFGVRGSSTSGYTKKPYKLKFLDKPSVKPFGMTKGKSWTLLANYLDQSDVRDKVGLDLGRKLAPTATAPAGNIAWTPDSRYVEMFVNDQYRGAYLMTESVKIDSSRINVDETNGMVMEVDGASVSDSSLGFLSPHNIAFKFKDPDTRETLPGGGVDPTGVTSGKLSAIKARVTAFESKLYSSTTSTRAQYPDYLDQGSAIDYYFIKEFTKDNDADFYRSHYFSWTDPNAKPTPGRTPSALDDGKFHFGPAWDFDRSAGNITDTDTSAHIYTASPNGWCLRGTGTSTGRPNYKTHWFVQLFKDAGFSQAVKDRWAVVRPIFEAAQTDVAADKAALGVGADNDRHRWASEPKRYKAHTFNGITGYEGEIAFVTNWYKKRLEYFDANM